MPVIIRGAGATKKIKDATITPEKVLYGEVGYGNGFQRIVGSHVCQPKIETITLRKDQEVSIPVAEDVMCCKSYGRIAQMQRADSSYESLLFLNVYKFYDNVAVLGPEKNDNATHYTVLKKIYPNAKYCSDTYLVIKVNNIPLYIHLGKPVVFDSYVEPNSFTCKFCKDFVIDGDTKRSIIKYAGPGSVAGYYGDASAEIYLDITNGIITEMGLAIRVYYPNVNRYYSEDDIELSIVHI